jgi:hypothetical protein
MDNDNIKAYLNPFNFVYETQNSNEFYIIKNKRSEYYDYKIKFTVTNSFINIDLITGLITNNELLKSIMIRINHYISNLPNKESIVLIIQKGYRYGFVIEVVKCIELI